MMKGKKEKGSSFVVSIASYSMHCMIDLKASKCCFLHNSKLTFEANSSATSIFLEKKNCQKCTFWNSISFKHFTILFKESLAAGSRVHFKMALSKSGYLVKRCMGLAKRSTLTIVAKGSKSLRLYKNKQLNSLQCLLNLLLLLYSTEKFDSNDPAIDYVLCDFVPNR
uniref:Uncharacterized protein n=1 Tax=Romanomermis culicivorax TaxID=13658 RepID=A0A915L9E0_ROMCU